MKKILLILIFTTSLTYAKLMLGFETNYIGAAKVSVNDNYDSDYNMNGGMFNFFIGYQKNEYGVGLEFHNVYSVFNGESLSPGSDNNDADITIVLHRDTKRVKTVIGVGSRTATRIPHTYGVTGDKTTHTINQQYETETQTMTVFHMSNEFALAKYVAFVIGFRIASYDGSSDKDTKAYIKIFSNAKNSLYLNIGYMYLRREILSDSTGVNEKSNSLFVGVGYEMK